MTKLEKQTSRFTNVAKMIIACDISTESICNYSDKLNNDSDRDCFEKCLIEQKKISEDIK